MNYKVMEDRHQKLLNNYIWLQITTNYFYIFKIINNGNHIRYVFQYEKKISSDGCFALDKRTEGEYIEYEETHQA